MARRKPAVAPQHPLAVLGEALEKHGQALNKIRQPGPSSVQPDNWEETSMPAPYETILHWPGGHRPADVHSNLVYYHPGYIDPDTNEEVEKGWKYVAGPAIFAIKVFADNKVNKTGDMLFGFTIPKDLDKTKLRWAQLFNTTAGGGSTICQVRNITRGIDMLTTRVQVDGGEYDSEESSVDHVVNIGGSPANPNNKVFTSNRMAIDVDAVGSGSKGLGIYLAFA